jgi:hypothetical protein
MSGYYAAIAYTAPLARDQAAGFEQGFAADVELLGECGHAITFVAASSF